MISILKSLSIALALSASVVAMSGQVKPDPEVIAQSQVARPVIYQLV